MPDSLTARDVGPITNILVEDYTQGYFDEVYMIYTKFRNTVVQEPTIDKLLPIEPAEPARDDGARVHLSRLPRRC